MQTPEINDILEKILNTRVAVYGDFCLDAYWLMDNRASEISIETGLYTETVGKHYYSPGGAGNVVANLAALQPASIQAIGTVGDDLFGRELTAQLQALGTDTSTLFIQKEEFDTYTYLKRHVNQQEQPRIDFGAYNQRSEATDKRLLEAIEKALQNCDVLIFNQQVTGSINHPDFIDGVNALFSQYSDTIVLLDSRHFNDKIHNTYRKTNDRELAILTGQPSNTEESLPLTAVSNMGSQVYKQTEKPLFVTCGERGILSFDALGQHYIPGLQLKGKLDTVGAGDTTISAIALCLAAGLSAKDAAEFANLAAGVTVQKRYTTGTASAAEILDLATEPHYSYNPDLALNERMAKYWPGTEFEICEPKAIERLGHIKYAVFDHDGTISTLRHGWEQIMEPMMIKAILGAQYDDIDTTTFNKVKEASLEFIQKTTGIQTIYQMEGLIQLIRDFGFVAPENILDKFQYKEIYNDGLMEMVEKRMAKLAAGELQPEDYTMKGAVTFLQALKDRGVVLYLASGTDVDDVRHEAQTLGYAPLFDGGIHGALKEYTKFSKKMIIEKIIRENNLHGHELMVVGDGPDEIREGRRAGGIAIGIASNEPQRYGHNPEKRPRLVKAGAHMLIPDFSQHQALLSLLFQKDQNLTNV
ncbi:rfaE bifunctional protein kinase chain/domain [Dyadobacter jejuensis]|uniref:RfaE bifunctional protein kinase chain/domain n=1 Tax=Dyadobacter jejuensis TaxID=1082580 RepID=A0A316AKJ8_9BACT|nr:PfkB family carbohydrate kinase [Dyadobacter jejuensis]PWJ57769.1 rfaE bifunctional protein kinase chain/domain [Dyadobacter jejuensis]